MSGLPHYALDPLLEARGHLKAVLKGRHMVRFPRTAQVLGTLVWPLILVLIATPQGAVAQGMDLAPRAVVNPPAKNTPNPKAAGQLTNSSINTKAIIEHLNQELGVDLGSTIAGWQNELDRIERDLGQPRLRYSELSRLRGDLQELRDKIDGTSNRLQPRLDADKAQMKLLGPAPAADQPPEPEQAARARAELNYHLGLLSEGQTAAASANLRIDDLSNKIQDLRRANFTSILFRPIPGVYAYETWAKVPSSLSTAAGQARDLIADWWRGIQDYSEIGYLAVEALMLSLLLALASWHGVRRLRRRHQDDEPPFWRRASAAAGVMILRALPGVVPVVFLYGMVASTQALPERIDWLFYLTTQSVVIICAVGALVSTAFAPGAARWRLVPVSDGAAVRICSLTMLLAFVYCSTTLLYAITRLLQAPFALTIAIALPSSLLLAGIVVLLLRTPVDGDSTIVSSSPFFRLVRITAWVIVTAIVVSALTGYLPLARFLAQQLIVTGSILGLIYLLLLWVDGFVQGLSDDDTALGRRLKQTAGPERARSDQLALPISLFLKFTVLVLSVPLIMLQWGYSWPDIREWYRQLFFGLHVGNTDVTLGALMASIIVFGLGYGAARLFQGWLDLQVLQPAGISGGVRNSIKTGVGYVGILIAALVAFSYAGFNLSNLAIIAGALSVGIGFGLQSLVNNFVSGLILLAERPIRVGDWVVVGGEEGYVRKISVRSTEIETFDRAHVLIPNAYFIAEKVKNWTFRNNVRRIAIPVNVAYDSNARQVQAALLDVARSSADVMRTPEPFVTLDEFGATGLSFTLYAFIADITKAGSVKTNLSMGILEAFSVAGIVIPFGRVDVAIRKMEWLRELIAGGASPPTGDGSGNGQTRPRASMSP